MRKLGLWASWAVLLLALGAAAAPAGQPADDDDDAPPAKPAGPDPAARPRDGWNPFLSRLFGQDQKKPAPAKPDKKSDADKKDDAPAPRASAHDEIGNRVVALEKAKLRRRQEVCLRLREIARETGDDALEQKAIQLDQFAFEVYQQRTLHYDEEQLEQRLPSGSAAAASRLNAPSKGGDADGNASVREVRP
jgi:hypothetical protein